MKNVSTELVLKTLRETVSVLKQKEDALFHFTIDHDEKTNLVQVNNSGWKYSFKINKAKNSLEDINGKKLDPFIVASSFTELLVMEMAMVYNFGKQSKKQEILSLLNLLPKRLLLTALVTDTVKAPTFKEIIPHLFSALEGTPGFESLKLAFLQIKKQEPLN